MKILLLVNNWVGWQVLKWLKERDEEIVGLVIHPVHKQKYAERICRVADLPPEKIFDGSKLHQRRVSRAIRLLSPDIGISVLFDYILKPDFLRLFAGGVVNLHPSYLPFNRGQFPNVWSIVEGTPAGVTLHFMDEHVDTGRIIAQSMVDIDAVDTGETLYRKLEKESVKLFRKTWPLIKSGKTPHPMRPTIEGTCHKKDDVEKIDCIEPDRLYTARELINIIRARTFPPYAGSYFKAEGKKVFLRLQLTYGSDSET